MNGKGSYLGIVDCKDLRFQKKLNQ